MLKKLTLFSLALVLLSASLSPAWAQFYTYDQDHSAVTFTLKNLGMTTVAGKFKKFGGSFHFNPEKIEESEVEILIQSGSVDASSSSRDKQLRSADFFSSEKYPIIRFRSRTIKNIQGKKFEIHGDLTIKGIKKPAIFYTEFLEDPLKTGRLHFKTWAVIQRNDYALGTQNIWNPLVRFTNEELRIDLDIEGVPSRLDFVAL
jgi:polyisoprenoid-binding protein YceI